MKRALSVILVLALVAALFVGCAGKTEKKSGSDSVEGTYTLQTVDGKDILTYFADQYGVTVEELRATAESQGMDLNVTMTCTLNKDKTAVVRETGFGFDESTKGTWEQSGNSITLTTETGEVIQMTYSNNTLTFPLDAFDGATCVFKK